MNLKTEIDSRIAGAGGEGEWVIPCGRAALAIRHTRADELAVSLEHCRLTGGKLAEAGSFAELNALCRQIGDKLRYLLEPLEVIEADQEELVIQMRSAPPHRDDGGTWYYELSARQGELSLLRFVKPKGSPRRAAEITLTREMLARLVGDLKSVAG